MANAKQKYELQDAQSTVIPVSAIINGSFVLNEASVDTNPIDPTSDAATQQTALEAASTIGSGNTLVTPQTNGALVEFVSGKANTAMATMTQTSSTLLATANTIAVTNLQNGSAGTSATASNNVYQVASTPSTETVGDATLDLGGAVGGTFNLDSGASAISVDVAILLSTGVSYMQAKYDTFFGAGGVTFTDNGDGTYDMSFPATGLGIETWNTLGNVDDSTIGGTGVVYTQTTPPSMFSVGAQQIDHCTFSGTPSDGAMNFDSQSLVWDTDASTLTLDNGGTASGVPSSGLIVTTYPDYGTYTPVAVDGGTLVFGAQPQIVSVANSDVPTQGNEVFTIDGTPTTEAFNVSAATLAADILTATSIAWGVTGSGTIGSPWLLTAPTNAANVTFTVVEDLVTPAPLLKAVNAIISIIQVGSGSSNSSGSFLYLF